MEHKTLLHEVQPNQLAEIVSDNVKKQLLELKNELLNKNANDELLTRKQACGLLQIEQTTLYHWVKAGKIPCYGIANRRYFKRSEIISALKIKK